MQSYQQEPTGPISSTLVKSSTDIMALWIYPSYIFIYENLLRRFSRMHQVQCTPIEVCPFTEQFIQIGTELEPSRQESDHGKATGSVQYFLSIYFVLSIPFPFLSRRQTLGVVKHCSGGEKKTLLSADLRGHCSLQHNLNLNFSDRVTSEH